MSTSLIGKQLGKYKIIEKLGSGGMADVYKGVQIGLEREVAIKVLPPAFAQDKEMVKRFRRESQATAKLSHPNIITIYDSGEQNGNYYYVMEYLKADSLEDVLAKEKKLALPRAIKIAQDILKALDYTHNKQIVHRDLKPANIKFDPRENAIVTDFGLVKDMGETAITNNGESLGTPQYMSPEQLRGEEVDARSDIYQVGVIVYEMLGGRPPLDMKAAGGMTASKILGQKPPQLKELNSEVPDDVSTFVMKAIAESPADRWQTARDLLNELKKIELKIKARKASTSRPSSAISGSISVSRASSTTSMSSSELSSSYASASASGLMSSWSAILHSPKDRDALMKMALVAIPVFILGAVGVFKIFWSRPPAQLVEKAIDVESHKVKISWKTNQPCYSFIEYWPASSSNERLFSQRTPDEKQEHVHDLKNLTPDRGYQYRFLFSYSPDGNDDLTASEVFDYTTRPEIQISSIHVEEFATKAIITWETNVRTDTVVKYGKSTDYEETQSNPEQKSEQTHSITLEGLTPNTPYHFQIVASDPQQLGQPITSDDNTFSTRTEDSENPETNREDALVNLTKSYVDKLTRMTPDEREKLKKSIQKFTAPKGDLSPAQKKALVERPTNPTREDEFNDRLQQMGSWLKNLQGRGKNVKKFEMAPRQLQSQYYINKVAASKRLDMILRDLQKLDA